MIEQRNRNSNRFRYERNNWYRRINLAITRLKQKNSKWKKTLIKNRTENEKIRKRSGIVLKRTK